MTSASLSIARLIAACCAASLLLCACTTPRTADPSAAGRDATAALIAHREFEAAARAAPEWTSAALSTITRLEAEISRQHGR